MCMCVYISLNANEGKKKSLVCNRSHLVQVIDMIYWIKKLWYIYTMEYFTAERRSSYPLQQHGWI